MPRAMLTLFQLQTMDEWVASVWMVKKRQPLMAVFFTVAFVRFVLLTFLVIMPIAIGFVATGRNKTCYK